MVRNAFYGTRGPFTALTGTHHSIQSWARWIQSAPSHFCHKIRFNITLPSTPTCRTHVLNQTQLSKAYHCIQSWARWIQSTSI